MSNLTSSLKKNEGTGGCRAWRYSKTIGSIFVSRPLIFRDQVGSGLLKKDREGRYLRKFHHTKIGFFFSKTRPIKKKDGQCQEVNIKIVV